MDLRQTLTRYRVDWRDRGNNCSRGYVNIRCPLCKDDPSYHLRVSEELTGWYCLRSTKHKGRGLRFLFTLLKIPTEGLPEYSEAAQTERPPREIDVETFRSFLPAENSPEMLEYIKSRRFRLPKEICTRFNLKCAPYGRWAGRLIIPLTAGWTGRSVRSHIEPRYLSETDDTGFFMYGSGLSAILVEGPLDAMKLASVSSQFLFLGMTGGRISPALIYTIREKKVRRLYLSPDSTVDLEQRIALRQELRASCFTTQIIDVKLPVNEATGDLFKDHGELTEGQARAWLYTLPT